MTQNKYGTLLKSIISSIHKNYQTDELAYLSLTSKIENPLRDKIAFELQKSIGKEKIVCREWTNNRLSKSKADIAILDIYGIPECIVEFKAHSSITGIGEWSNCLIKDIRKNQELYKQTEMIFVLFANFVSGIPKNQIFNHSIKYYDSITKSVNRKYSLENQKETWEKSLARKNIISDFTNYIIDAGSYQDNKVYINTFIHENIIINEQNN
jgi:hypothetical protein